MGFPISHNDQLNKIFQILGKPNDYDLSFITDDNALEYIDTFSEQKKVDLNVMYPNVPETAIDLLEKTL